MGGERDREAERDLHEHSNWVELECQNPATSIVGEDGIRPEGKLQDSSPFAEGLQEAEQNSKNDACQQLSYTGRAACERLVQ